MNIAIAVWKGEISPVFDTTAHLLVAEIEDHKLTGQEIIGLEGLTHFQRIELLGRLRINVFICDGITKHLLENIRDKNIKTIPNICGNAYEILDAVRDGKDIKALFSMPRNKN